MIDDLILQLAIARQQEDELRKRYGGELALLKAATNSANQLEKTVRETVIDNFNKFGETPSHEAVSIRVRTTIDYSHDENYQNALDKLPGVFKINQEKFALHAEKLIPLIAAICPEVLEIDNDKMAQAVKSGDAPWAVSIEIKVPTVYLQSKLGQYVIADDARRSGDQTTN